MTTVTDFEAWLSENEPESFEEALSLHYAVMGQKSGIYDVKKNASGHLYVSRTGGETTLALLSSKAISAFARRIESYNEHRELGWEGAAAFVRAMEKDD